MMGHCELVREDISYAPTFDERVVDVILRVEHDEEAASDPKGEVIIAEGTFITCDGRVGRPIPNIMIPANANSWDGSIQAKKRRLVAVIKEMRRKMK